MKKYIFNLSVIAVLAGLIFLPAACTEDLLDQPHTTELPTDAFWATEGDATTALMGAYANVRPLFDRDYYFDGQGEYTRVRGTSATNGNLRLGDAYQAANYNPSGYGAAWDKYFRYMYAGVHRANYVIENARKLRSTLTSSASVGNIETIIGEARLLRGMVYFRLISMWGDVPHIHQVVSSNEDVASLERTPIAVVKDSIMADFTYAFEKLPTVKTPGRAAKPAALAFRGKLQLYWASWNKNGWPELPNFTPNATEADAAFAAAAADLKAVIDNYGLTLFRNGDPGQIDALGKADILPNYFYLFMPVANNDPEMIMTFTHGGTGTGQGEELMRDFSGRSHEGSQCWVSPRFALADRYQDLTTGNFATPLIPMNPTTTPTARTAPNSAVNPQSYANRDYRMKSTIQWDYEMSLGMISLKSTGMCPFIYTSWASNVTIGGVPYITYNTDGSNTGYVFRKFVRNYAGQGRSDGDFSWPVMRLADVYLMYAEASNEVSGPQPDAINLVNAIRRRGNLPPLTAAMTADEQSFFLAIEQERIVELVAEGHRSFDLRRWRALERVWGPPGGNGVQTRDTHGANRDVYFRNTDVRTYEQAYIFRIPPGERDRNPNLTQNTPWL
jgi:starch-binding outer membrane protein, SusD/RagB family